MRYYQLFETTSHTYTVYHGTSVEFNGFQSRFRGTAHGTEPINMEGFNFTDSAECAATFGAIVLKCEVTITRPFVIDAKGQNYSQFKHILNDKLSRISRSKYDGIIIKRFADAGIHGDEYIESNHYIPFSEDQIRIIGEELTESRSHDEQYRH